MSKKLVIVESPAKAKTINKILGAEYVVKPSMGHVRDLPVKSLGIDVAGNFEPKYEVVAGRKKLVAELKKLANTGADVYLAPDPDREGEAIAWHLRELLKRKNVTFYRVHYNEITPSAVRRAFENAGEIDMNRVNAQQARRVLDRIVGYMVSPILWRTISKGLSAGRVQSVALRLLCEREKAIMDFVPEEYWVIGLIVRKKKDPMDPFRVKLVKINGDKAVVGNAESGEQIRSDLVQCGLEVIGIKDKEVARKAGPPFITSTLQQAGSTFYGFAPSRTMRIAQDLYEGVDLGSGPVGLITYMRTDSVAVAADAVRACRDFIAGSFGERFCPEKPNYFKSKASAQEAHEAIRPTDVNRTPESLADRLDAGQLKLYRLIWTKFVASQMAPAVIAMRTIEVEAAGAGTANRYLFHATSSDVVFEGYMKLTGTPGKNRKTDDDGDQQNLPPLEKGESLEYVDWLADKKETQPPPRFNEASLIKALELNGIGRPSTYAQVIATLVNRKYAGKKDKALVPTDLGGKVNALLVGSLGELFDVKFTAFMEESLDDISAGRVEWRDMLREFYARFSGWISAINPPSVSDDDAMKMLQLLDGVKEWKVVEGAGRRVFDDRKFVESIRDVLKEGKKKVTDRQFNVLLKIAIKYRDQLDGLAGYLDSIGMKELLEKPDEYLPLESTVKKLEMIRRVKLDEKTLVFVNSLKRRVDTGRRLSDAQRSVLDRLVLSHSGEIQNFEKERGSLELREESGDEESADLINALRAVRKWNPPVVRGNRQFDDKKFFESLDDYYSKRRFLSDKQKQALRKMAERYKSQIGGTGEAGVANAPEGGNGGE